MSRDPSKLRSNFEEGTSRWAVRRAQWRALGLTDEDMAKPKIAVINTSSEIAICFSHLDGIAAEVKNAIREAGGLPFEIRTSAPSDFIISGGRRATFILPTRDLIANDIEVQVEGAQLDGMILLTSCDKTVPGQLMAAARLDIPSLMVICGYQSSGHIGNEHVDIEEVFLHAGYHAQGTTSFERLKEMSEVAISSPGVCSGMGTANSMHSVTEALGMCLPGAAPVAANSPKMWDHVRESGHRIVDMVWEDLRPRQILTEGAFRNAARVDLAQAGSINCIKHLQAVALEAGVDIDLYDTFDKEGAWTPVLTAVRPIGPLSIEEFEAAGGARGTMKQLESLLDTDVMTVSGKTVKDNLEAFEVADDNVIRPLDNPWGREAAIVLLKGSLAPDTGVVKVGLRTPDRRLSFKGKAKVYESSVDAEDDLKAGKIGKGDVLVLRRQGVRVAPAWAARRGWSLPSRAQGSDRRSRSSRTGSCPVWSTRGWWSAKCSPNGPRADRSRWSKTATRSTSTSTPRGSTCWSMTRKWRNAAQRSRHRLRRPIPVGFPSTSARSRRFGAAHR